MRYFEDHVVIITGGSKGIGRETAKLFAILKAQVIITGRRKEELEKTCSLINSEYGKCDFFQGDVSAIQDCERIIKAVIDKYHRIDILINNAGMSMRGLFLETNLELFHKIIDINFTGAVNMTKFALDALIKSQGSVVFISSLSGLKGIPGIAPYATAKMALTGFSESLRAEVSHHHVHVGIIYVGFTENDQDKTIYAANGDRIPLRREKNNDTQQSVARSILKVVRKRRKITYLTVLGKAAAILYRFFPRLSSYLLSKFALRSEMYKS
ncbi:MAG: SDR family oxidoreductase [Candidatus Izemoplasmatales bacterium]|nr:SDR family oxidoreductase [Candidatus Izemoplasmatales bacterium]